MDAKNIAKYSFLSKLRYKIYTLKEIEHHTKIPVSTLKRYLTKYGIKRK